MVWEETKRGGGKEGGGREREERGEYSMISLQDRRAYRRLTHDGCRVISLDTALAPEWRKNQSTNPVCIIIKDLTEKTKSPYDKI
jgi:hypothetical protein